MLPAAAASLRGPFHTTWKLCPLAGSLRFYPEPPPDVSQPAAVNSGSCLCIAVRIAARWFRPEPPQARSSRQFAVCTIPLVPVPTRATVPGGSCESGRRTEIAAPGSTCCSGGAVPIGKIEPTIPAGAAGRSRGNWPSAARVQNSCAPLDSLTDRSDAFGNAACRQRAALQNPR